MKAEIRRSVSGENSSFPPSTPTAVFKTQREFNNKFPSKFYICSCCSKIIPDKYTCMYCGWRADGLFKTMGQGYKFIIEEQSPEIQEIFKPIETQNIN